MKSFHRFVLSFCLLVAGATLSAAAFAAPVNATGTVSYVLPVLGCMQGQPTCNAPLTGADALTGIDVYVSTSPIPDTFTGPPTLSVGPAVTTTPVSVSANNGDTVYVRLKARNSSGSSVFTAPATFVVHLAVIPNPPTSVTFTLVISAP